MVYCLYRVCSIGSITIVYVTVEVWKSPAAPFSPPLLIKTKDRSCSLCKKHRTKGPYYTHGQIRHASCLTKHPPSTQLFLLVFRSLVYTHTCPWALLLLLLLVLLLSKGQQLHAVMSVRAEDERTMAALRKVCVCVPCSTWFPKKKRKKN